MNFSNANDNKSNILFFDVLESTNDYAKALINKEKQANFTIVHAALQTYGRGQRGNNWMSGAGLNLTASWIYYPVNFKLTDYFFLSMWVALSVYDALSDILPNHHSIKIKWPNDIYVDNKKVAGILIENSNEKDLITSSVIGIGVNVNETDFKGLDLAASLKTFLSCNTDINQLLNALNESLLAKNSLLKHKKVIKAIYTKHLFRLNETRFYETNNGRIEGQIIGCTDQGLLQIQTETQLLQFDLKEIRYVF